MIVPIEDLLRALRGKFGWFGLVFDGFRVFVPSQKVLGPLGSVLFGSKSIGCRPWRKIT